jgi:hypothetical protein
MKGRNLRLRLARRLALLSMVIAGLSCGGDSGPGLPAILRCDIATVECQSDIYESVSALLEADPAAPPSVRVISPEQFRREILDGTSPFVPPVEGPLHRAHELMGFVFDEEGDLSEQQLAYWVRTVVAYYSEGSITILDRKREPGDAQFTLAHEYVHAIQEREFGPVHRADLPTSDDTLAHLSVTEGDAALFAHDWYFRMLGAEPDEINWGYVMNQRREDLYELAANRDDTLFASVNRFPYIAGMSLMHQALNYGGSAGRRALFESPPSTSYDVLYSSPRTSRSSSTTAQRRLRGPHAA